MSYCIAREMRDLHGFADRVRRVNAIAPGAVDTARFKDECKDDPQQFWKEAQATVCHSCSDPNCTFLCLFYYIKNDANHFWTKRLLFANPCPANRWRRVSCILQARILVVMFTAKCSTWIVESRVRSSGRRRSVYKRP